MRSRKPLFICFAIRLFLFCLATFLSAETALSAAVNPDLREAEAAVAERCLRTGVTVGTTATEACAAGFEKAQDLFASKNRRSFNTDEECNLAETQFRQQKRQYTSRMTNWCAANFSDQYSQKRCQDAGFIYFDVLYNQGFCPRKAAVTPKVVATAAPANVSVKYSLKYPLEPEAGGFGTEQYLADYKDPHQIFDSPKIGRWPGGSASTPSRTRDAAITTPSGTAQDKASGASATGERPAVTQPGKQAQEIKAVEAITPIPQIQLAPEYTQKEAATDDNTPGKAVELNIIIPPTKPANAGNSGSAPADFSQAASVDAPAPAKTNEAAPESASSSSPAQDSDNFYSRFGTAPTAPRANLNPAPPSATLRPDPAGARDLSGGIPPAPVGQPSRPSQTGPSVQSGGPSEQDRQVIRNIPPIGRVISPVISGAPPEIPENQGNGDFNAGEALGSGYTPGTATERFGTAIPSFAAEQAAAGISSSGNADRSRPSGNGTIYIPPPGGTSSATRGPVGQMRQ